MAENHIVAAELNIFARHFDFSCKTIRLTTFILWMFEVISFFTYQTKCLLLRPREVMHGLLTYSVKQRKASLFFLLTGSDTQHENVATAGGLMWFMVPGSRLVFRCEPVLHWSSSKPKPLGVLLIGSNIGESFWTFTALAQVASGLQKQVFFFLLPLFLPLFLTLWHTKPA